jgi:hypothetical protein
MADLPLVPGVEMETRFESVRTGRQAFAVSRPFANDGRKDGARRFVDPQGVDTRTAPCGNMGMGGCVQLRVMKGFRRARRRNQAESAGGEILILGSRPVNQVLG